MSQQQVGETRTMIRPTSTDHTGPEPTEARMGLVNGTFPACSADGARDVQSPARATKAHAPSLARLPRALTVIAIASESAESRYTLTPPGAALRSDEAGDAAPVGFDWHGWSASHRNRRTNSPERALAPTGSEAMCPTVRHASERAPIVEPECLVQFPNAFGACRTVIACMGDRP